MLRTFFLSPPLPRAQPPTTPSTTFRRPEPQPATVLKPPLLPPQSFRFSGNAPLIAPTGCWYDATIDSPCSPPSVLGKDTSTLRSHQHPSLFADKQRERSVFSADLTDYVNLGGFQHNFDYRDRYLQSMVKRTASHHGEACLLYTSPSPRD